VLLSWQASTIPLVIAVVIVVAVVEGRRLWQRTKELEGSVPAQYPGESLHPERTRQIAGTQARAGLTDSAPLLVGVTAVAAVLLGAGALAGAWASGRVPGEATTQWPGVLHAGAEAAQGMGSWLVGASVVAMVALGRRAYRSAGARRTVGILWDIGTFWPRAAHPFAPPCYAERAVPDLTWRMTTWTAQYPSGRIILSGHSQGTVLAAAAAWQLDPATRDRIALLTYGSPLERLYGRAGSRRTSGPRSSGSSMASCGPGATCGGVRTRSADRSASAEGVRTSTARRSRIRPLTAGHPRTRCPRRS
jgi:hypothetical protein